MDSIKDMVIKQLKDMGAEGLCNQDSECGCVFEDFMPCQLPDIDTCIAAKVGKIVDGIEIMVPIDYKGGI